MRISVKDDPPSSVRAHCNVIAGAVMPRPAPVRADAAARSTGLPHRPAARRKELCQEPLSAGAKPPAPRGPRQFRVALEGEASATASQAPANRSLRASRQRGQECRFSRLIVTGSHESIASAIASGSRSPARLVEWRSRFRRPRGTRSARPHTTAGGMLWLKRNRLCGSYRRLSWRSRSKLVSP